MKSLSTNLTSVQRIEILNLIENMANSNYDELKRTRYHHRCLQILRIYDGDDSDNLIDKYLLAEQKMEGLK